jgi:hypothetical protein
MSLSDRRVETDRATETPRDRWNYLALAILVALGTVVRLIFIGVPMRADEAYTYNEYATKSVYDAISLYTFPNNHLFHTLLVHWAVKFLGGAPWVIRLPALLSGISLIPASYLMVRRLAGPSAALFTAALVAASDPLISYSVNGRGYTILCLITVLLVATASRVMVDGGRAGDWVALTLVPALGFFTVPIMLLPYGGIVLWIVLAWMFGHARALRIDRLALSLLVAAVLTVLLYVPTLTRTGAKSVLANPFVSPRPFEEVLSQLPGSLVEVWVQWNLGIPRVLAFVMIGAWVCALFISSSGRQGVRVMTGVTLTVFLWSLAVVFYQSRVPFDRVWLFLLPLYLGCLGAGAAALLDRVWNAQMRWAFASSALGLGAFLMAFVVGSDSISKDAQRLTINHGTDISRRLAPLLGPDTAVITELPCDGPLKYYFLVNRVPVEPLYDYRIARARRLFVVVNRPNGQTAQGVLRSNRIPMIETRDLRLLEDHGLSAVYVLDRW